ncbi:unnamed protein product [Penicillium nalgiovense]|uniref:Uncharacterized protein n=1 Tax=Penicillium nalgiovense TaxID=60175 RepID=A0A9W4N868_PENNA|nr:unnamed protein product [Penicillium nalgiovense]CAG8030394.1 unnamed protein product [Penicillium nalgiovense]CAG8060836.1 unnamed protein product [Penicillium nalgiovense]CAG8081718.1 unnamed protein product [Penicillium nalgiovense]CAG8126963.1 unnamed protein product [Penicillium nalgiovense]
MFLLPLHPLHSLFHQKKDPEIETDFKMPFRDPLLDGYNCPVLLRSNMHREHVLKSESQEPKLPPYMSNSAGRIVVGHDEVFCRVPSHQQNHNPISATDICQHFISHGVQVATHASGQLKQAQEDAAVQWYKSVQEVEEDDYEEDEEEEDEEHNDEDKHDEDYEDDGDEEDDDDEDYD